MPQTRQFLEHLYPDNLPANTHLLVWTIPDKTSYWFTDIDEVEPAIEIMGDKNVYIGCGLSPKNYGAIKRATAANIAAIPGFWADIDYGESGHKGKLYPPDQGTALRILDELAVRPTIVLHSGNGLQAWWLWDKPWVFVDKTDHDLAAAASKEWGVILNEAAGDYSVDSVSDLSRVLRLPGTNNVKDPANPKPVKILIEDGPRWAHREAFIEQAGITLAPPKAKASKSSSKKTKLAGIPVGDPSAARMTILWSIDERARDAWMGEPASWLKDQSASSRDLSVATRAAMAGWPESEIGQLIRAGRELRKDDLKHPLYYELTIAKAIENSQRPQHIRQADEDLGIDPDSATPESRLEKISELIGIAPPITKITKTDSDPVIYRIYWRGKKMEIGDGSGILDQTKFRKTMYDIAGVVVSRRKAPEWDRIAQMFANCVTILQVGKEGEATTQYEVYLEEYFETFTEDLAKDWQTKAQERQPFIREVEGVDRVYFSTAGAQGLATWIWANYNVRPNPTRLIGILSELGWQPEKQSIRNGDDVFRRSVWWKTVNVTPEN